DGDHHAAEEQGSDEVFAADLELLGEILDGNALSNGDGAGNRQVAFRDLRGAHARGIALERNFLVLDVALIAATAGAGTRGTPGSCWGVGRRKQAAGADTLTSTAETWTAAEAGASGEAGPATRASGASGTTRAAGEGARGVHGPACAVGGAGSGSVGGTGAGLRHDDAADGRRGSGGCLRNLWSGGRRRWRRRYRGCSCGSRAGGCRCGSGGWSRRRDSRGLDDDGSCRCCRGNGRRCCRRADGDGSCGRTDDGRTGARWRARRSRRTGGYDGRGCARLRHDAARRRRLIGGRLRRGDAVGGRRGSSRGCRARRCRGRARGGCGGRGGDRGTRGRGRGTSLGSGFGLLALEDRLQGVAGLGDVREVKGWLGVGGWFGGCCRTGAAGQVVAYLLGLMLLDRGGVRLLLGDADGRESVKNGLALDLQFPCKIVDANFAHLILLLRAAIHSRP